VGGCCYLIGARDPGGVAKHLRPHASGSYPPSGHQGFRTLLNQGPGYLCTAHCPTANHTLLSVLKYNLSILTLSPTTTCLQDISPPPLNSMKWRFQLSFRSRFLLALCLQNLLYNYLPYSIIRARSPHPTHHQLPVNSILSSSLSTVAVFYPRPPLSFSIIHQPAQTFLHRQFTYTTVF
jgi:hypothetical protein